MDQLEYVASQMWEYRVHADRSVLHDAFAAALAEPIPKKPVDALMALTEQPAQPLPCSPSPAS